MIYYLNKVVYKKKKEVGFDGLYLGLTCKYSVRLCKLPSVFVFFLFLNKWIGISAKSSVS